MVLTPEQKELLEESIHESAQTCSTVLRMGGAGKKLTPIIQKRESDLMELYMQIKHAKSVTLQDP